MRWSNCTGSAQVIAPLTGANWMDLSWRFWKVSKANSLRPQLWLSWVRWETHSNYKQYVFKKTTKKFSFLFFVVAILPLKWNNLEQYVCISISVGDKLWWADQGADQIGTCDKKDGGNWKVMRNNTSPMMHMKIYDEDVQKGSKHYLWQTLGSHVVEWVKNGKIFIWSPFALAGINLCSNNNGDCSQLCLPTSPTTRSCMCTAGYSLKTGQQSCEGRKRIHNHNYLRVFGSLKVYPQHTVLFFLLFFWAGMGSFLLYSVHEGIRGIPLDPADKSDALVPVSGTSLAVGIDFHAGEKHLKMQVNRRPSLGWHLKTVIISYAENDTIYWVDMGLSTISRAKRDQTWREDVVTNGIGRVEGITVDWIAGLASEFLYILFNYLHSNIFNYDTCFL